MAYKALLNNQIFFQTDASDNDLVLTSAKLDREVGTAGSFTFTIPPCNRYYGDFHKIIDYVDVYRDDELLFSGRVYSIGEAFDTQLKIVCEGLLTVFNDSVFRPITFQGSLRNLVLQLIDSHNEQVEPEKQIRMGYFFVDNSDCYRAYQNYESTISRLQDLVESYGGWMQVRKDSDGVLWFDWYDRNRDGVNQTIDFGQNLLDITQEENADGIVTVLVPLGAADDNNARLTIKSVNDGKDYIVADQQYIDKYGYIVGVKTWDDVNYASILKTKGQQWMTACLTPKKTINLTSIDLADAGFDVESFNPGQVVKANSAPHGINGEWFDVNTQSLDLLNPAQNKLTIGTQKIGYIKAARNESAETKRTLEQIVEKYATKTALELAQDHLTSVLLGSPAGAVIRRDTDDDGIVDEILIMDTTSEETARNVWRINANGWGHSSEGVDGPYKMGATLEDIFTVPYLIAGEINAGLIKTGMLQSDSGGSWWNLDTGELHIVGQTEIDKSKVFIREPTVPYYVGDLWVTGYNRNTSVVDYAIADDAICDMEGSSDGIGMIMYAKNAKTSGSFDEDDWVIITNYLDADAMARLEAKISTAELEIDTLTGQISQKASTTQLNELGSQITNVSQELDSQTGRIDLLATQVQTVADKSKTFRSEPIPPYEDGDTWITGSESYTAIVDEAIADDALVGWGKEIFVCTKTRSAGESFDWDDWILATNYIDDAQLESVRRGLRQEIRTAEIAIDAANGRIDLKADTTTVTALATRVQTAAIELQDAKVDIKAQQTVSTELAQRIQTAQISVDAQAGILAQVTDTGTVASGSRVDGNKLIGFINLTSTSATIHAERIDLEGAVSITSLDNSLKAKVNGALRGNVSIYYRSTSSTKPAKPDSAVTSTAVDSNNTWTLVMPRPKNGCYFYTCNQQTSDSGTTWTTVQAIPNADYTSKWCNSTDATYIDGSHIYTGTLDANAIKADTTISNHVSATNLDIMGGTIQVTSDSLDASYIHLQHSNINSWFGARYCGFEISASGNYYKTWWGDEINSAKTAVTGQTLSFNKRISGSTETWSWLGADYIGFDYGSNVHSWLSGTALLLRTGDTNTWSKWQEINQDGVHCYWGASGTTQHQAHIRLYNSKAQVYADQFYSTSYGDVSSDMRWKKNIKTLDIHKSAEWVLSQRPVEFNYLDEQGNPFRQHGILAQEAEPGAKAMRWDLVHEMDGRKSISYMQIITDLIATVQVLNEKIKVQDERIKVLEAKA